MFRQSFDKKPDDDGSGDLVSPFIAAFIMLALALAMLAGG